MQEQEHWRRLLLRTEETAKNYELAQRKEVPTKGCRLCSDPENITEFNYWRLMPNRFPYDRYFSICDMLVSKRHTNENKLTDEERAELFELRQTVFGDKYDLIFENLPKQKSIPHHAHYHLVKLKRPEEF